MELECSRWTNWGFMRTSTRKVAMAVRRAGKKGVFRIFVLRGGTLSLARLKMASLTSADG